MKWLVLGVVCVELVSASRMCAMEDNTGECSYDDIKALYDACSYGELEKVQALIAQDPRLITADSEEFGLPLNTTCKIDSDQSCKVIKILLEAGAPINKHSVKGFATPLLVAVNKTYQGNIKVLNILLAYGADPNAWHGDIQTLLEYAVFKLSKVIVKALVNGGVRIDDDRVSVERQCCTKVAGKGSVPILKMLNNADKKCARTWPHHLRRRLQPHDFDVVVPAGRDVDERLSVGELLDIFQRQLKGIPEPTCDNSCDLYRPIAEVRRRLISQEASPRRQLLVIASLVGPDGMLHPKLNMLGNMKSFCNAESIDKMMQTLPLGYVVPGNSLEALS